MIWWQLLQFWQGFLPRAGDLPFDLRQADQYRSSVRLVAGQKKAEVTNFKYSFNGHGLSATININEAQWKTGRKRLKRISGIGAAVGHEIVEKLAKCYRHIGVSQVAVRDMSAGLPIPYTHTHTHRTLNCYQNIVGLHRRSIAQLN